MTRTEVGELGDHLLDPGAAVGLDFARAASAGVDAAADEAVAEIVSRTMFLKFLGLSGYPGGRF